jgi:hypothetical protein
VFGLGVTNGDVLIGELILREQVVHCRLMVFPLQIQSGSLKIPSGLVSTRASI